MSKDKGLPIDYVKNITPVVAGDTFYNNFLRFDLVMDQQQADAFNSEVDDFDTYSIVSFASRPNTGKQPVGDDVVVDVYIDGEWHTDIPRRCAWELKYDIEKWRINHAALLAKFKEQGAKTVKQSDFQEQETETADFLRKITLPNETRSEFYRMKRGWPYLEVLCSLSGVWLATEITAIDAAKDDDFISLFNFGDQYQKAHQVALDTEALPKLSDLRDKMKVLAKGLLYDQIKRPVTVPPFSSEYYQSGNEAVNTDLHTPQVIEPWVGDHLTEKPVFTQEVEMLIGGGKNVPEVYKAGRFAYHGSKYSIFVTEDGKEYSRKNSKIKTRPIDSRTDDQRIYDALCEIIIPEQAHDLLASDKFTITLKGE